MLRTSAPTKSIEICPPCGRPGHIIQGTQKVMKMKMYVHVCGSSTKVYFIKMQLMHAALASSHASQPSGFQGYVLLAKMPFSLGLQLLIFFFMNLFLIKNITINAISWSLWFKAATPTGVASRVPEQTGSSQPGETGIFICPWINSQKVLGRVVNCSFKMINAASDSELGL